MERKVSFSEGASIRAGRQAGVEIFDVSLSMYGEIRYAGK